MRASLALASAITALAGAAHAAEQKGGLPQLNAGDFAPQLVWLVITFVLLWLIMARVALPRIGEVLEERQDRVRRDLAAAERLKRDTETALAAYEKALGDARASAQGIARQTREVLNADVEKQRGAVEKELAAKMAEAEARIMATKTKALFNVTEIAADATASIVGKLTGQFVSRDEVERALAASAPPPPGRK